jgi:hypothetical protein
LASDDLTMKVGFAELSIPPEPLRGRVDVRLRLELPFHAPRPGGGVMPLSERTGFLREISRNALSRRPPPGVDPEIETVEYRKIRTVL